MLGKDYLQAEWETGYESITVIFPPWFTQTLTFGMVQTGI